MASILPPQPPPTDTLVYLRPLRSFFPPPPSVNDGFLQLFPPLNAIPHSYKNEKLNIIFNQSKTYNTRKLGKLRVKPQPAQSAGSTPLADHHWLHLFTFIFWYQLGTLTIDNLSNALTVHTPTPIRKLYLTDTTIFVEFLFWQICCRVTKHTVLSTKSSCWMIKG